MADGFSGLFQQHIKNQREAPTGGNLGAVLAKQAISNQQAQADQANKIALFEAQERVKQKNKDAEHKRFMEELRGRNLIAPKGGQPSSSGNGGQNFNPIGSGLTGGSGTVQQQTRQPLQDQFAPQPTQQPAQQQGGNFPFIVVGGKAIKNPRFESPANRAKRVRLEGREERLDVERDFNRLKEFGGVTSQKQLKRFSDASGFDITSDLENDIGSGRVSKIFDKEGNVAFKIMGQQEFSRMISEGKFSTDEQKTIRQLVDERNAWFKVIDRLEDAGISAILQDPESGEGETPFKSREGLFRFVIEDGKFGPLGQPVGFASIPARSATARQFLKNPALAGVARDIELAFQKWRIRVTGVQASDKELKVLRRVIASLSDNPRVFFQTVKNFTDNAEQDFNNLLDVKESFGRDVTQFRDLLDSSAKKKGLGFRTQFSPSGSDEFSKMSEEELKAIIGGQ